MANVETSKVKSEKVKSSKKRPSNEFEAQLMFADKPSKSKSKHHSNDFEAQLRAADMPHSSPKKKRHSNEHRSRPAAIPDEEIDSLLMQDIDSPLATRKIAQLNNSTSSVVTSSTNGSKAASPPASNAASTSEPFDPTIFKRKERVKVYAGRRKEISNGSAGIPSLLVICQRYLQDHIDQIDELGPAPFHLLTGVFERCTTDQLDRISAKNPQLHEDLNPIWERHVTKIFPNEGGRKKRETWYQCYKRLCGERDEKLRAISARINRKTEESSAPVRRTAMLAEVINPLRMQKKQIRNGIAPTVSAPDAHAISQARREIGNNGSRAKLVSLGSTSSVKGSVLANSRPSSSGSASSNRTPAPKKGTLMMKAMRMMKNSRR